MKAQKLYDLREEVAFCSGMDLHDFFESVLGDPSPSGHQTIDPLKAKAFVRQCLAREKALNGGTFEGLYNRQERAKLVRFVR